MPKLLPKKATVKHTAIAAYWFGVGFLLAGAILSSLVLFYFQYSYKDRVIPGVFVNNIYIGEKTKDQLDKLFSEKNKRIGQNTYVLTNGNQIATVSAKTVAAGYDSQLIIDQAINLGKTKNLPSDIYIVLASYINGTFLSAPYTFDSSALAQALAPIAKEVHKEPVDAQFNFANNRVVAFRQSENGRDIDFTKLEEKINSTIAELAVAKSPGAVRIQIPIKVVEPNLTTEEVNKFGIIEQIGEGHSTFYHSIPGRIHNVALATSRINGVMVAPGEEFSFVKALGDVSAYTGYQQAYIISGGKTILGDGGGVCQVSTTLFRAILAAGLPITERHPHAYRVGYYEQGSPPGIDAATYVPTVDLKFKNDTGHHILIQAYANTADLSLSFVLYGTSDGRKSEISTPSLTNVAPAPADLYQDDPTLPVGTVKQVDFAAPGGRTSFTRTVTRNGKTILSDTFTSNYKPWQAIFLRGTKT